MLGLCGSSLCNRKARKARRAVEPVEPVEALGPEEPVRPVRPVRGVDMLLSMKQRLESSTSGRHWREL